MDTSAATTDSAAPTDFQTFRRAGRRGDCNMLCEVIMKTTVHCASPDDSTGSAALRMREFNIGFMPVCERDGRLLGAVTDRDIALRVVAEGLPADTPLRRIMSVDLVCCGAQDTVGRAQELMAASRKSRIICVDEAGRLEGIISLSDIAQMQGAYAISLLQQVAEREARPV